MIIAASAADASGRGDIRVNAFNCSQQYVAEWRGLVGGDVVVVQDAQFAIAPDFLCQGFRALGWALGSTGRSSSTSQC